MELAGRHVVLTGGAGGIGGALAERLAAEGVGRLVVADVDAEGAREVAERVGGVPVAADVSRAAGVRELVAAAEEAGPIDVFVSNAGITGPLGGPEAGDEEWDLTWRVNLMSHVWAAREVVPGMVERGEGCLVSVASAAGLLTEVSAAAYAVTKHAAVALAEWLAINYGDAGVRVCCVCPQGVRTPMLERGMTEPAAAAALRAGGLIDPAEVAEATVGAIRDERFLVLPHPEVAGHMARKAADPERWLGAMRSFVAGARAPAGTGEGA